LRHWCRHTYFTHSCWWRKIECLLSWLRIYIWRKNICIEISEM